MIRQPEIRVIVGCYNQNLANRFARKSRRIAEGRLLFRADRKAVDDWETLQDGGMRAVGVGGGITGQGGDLIVIDDPVKSREEANSEAYRERVFDWYTDDLYTRLQPGGAIVLIMTRWHEDDLAGRILASEDGPNWTLVNLPAQAEDNDPLGRAPGEALCPEWWGEAELANKRIVLGSWAYASLYQQRPSPEEGAIFKRSTFRYYQQDGDIIDLNGKLYNVSDCTKFATVDLAISEKVTADFTVVAIWAKTPDHDLVLLNLIRRRIDFPTTLGVIRLAWKTHQLDCVGIESVAYQRAAPQMLMLDGIPVRPLKPKGDKIARANLATIWFDCGKVWFPESATWLDNLETEMLSFPSAAHDDQVDAISYGCSENQRMSGMVPVPPLQDNADIDDADDTPIETAEPDPAYDPYMDADQWD